MLMPVPGTTTPEPKPWWVGHKHLESLARFYRTYYAPNNAALAVVGDVDEQEALGLIQRVTSFISPSLMREVATSHPRLWEYINEKRMKALDLWRGILVDGQERGEIRRDVDPEIFMLMLTTIAQNMITPTFLLEHDMTMPEMIEQVKLILIYGILEPDTREVAR